MKHYIEYITELKKLNLKEEESFVQAAKKGSTGTIKRYLKSDPHFINYQDLKLKRTALMWASIEKFLIVVKILLENGADPNIDDFDGRTPLHAASTIKIVDLLLENGSDVNFKNNKGEPPMVEYINYDWTGTQLIMLLERFLQKGLNLDIENDNGENLYDKIQNKIILNEKWNRKDIIMNLKQISNYIDEHFPKYKESWELRQDVGKYNL